MENKDIQQRANEYYEQVFDDELKRLIKIAMGEVKPSKREKADGINNEDDAQERLEEMAHDVSKYATYHQSQYIEWHITLAGGGPAARLVVRADYDGDITDVWFEFQDWYEPWTKAEDQDEELLYKFANIVGYYA